MSYQYKKIVPAERGTETIYEIVTAEDGLGFGFAEAEITRSARHYHLKTSETYVLISGRLKVWAGRNVYILAKPGDAIEIPKGVTHWAENLDPKGSSRITVHSTPAWTSDDHHYDE